MSMTWEDSIIIAGTKTSFDTLSPAKQQPHPDDISKLTNFTLPKNLAQYEKKDTFPLPTTEDREGYHGNRHYEYWLSGLSDCMKISAAAKKHGIKLTKKSRILDFGCASGRVLRHFAAYTNVDTWGCDISENHVRWCNQFLPPNAKVFQNTSLPHLQIEDNFFDVVYAMSVFTHIEAFETSWLCELHRVLKPGGIVYTTIHDERSWESMPHDWGAGHAVMQHPDFKKEWLKTGFPGDKFISRWDNNRSYSSNVFYKEAYIRRVWGKFFKVIDIIPKASDYQTGLILQKD